MKREFFNSIGHGPSFAVEGNDGRLEPLTRDRGRREASGVFLSKMPVDKVNRIRIAKILAGDLSLDRGRADDTVLAVTMLKHSSLCCDRISC